MAIAGVQPVACPPGAQQRLVALSSVSKMRKVCGPCSGSASGPKIRCLSTIRSPAGSWSDFCPWHARQGLLLIGCHRCLTCRGITFHPFQHSLLWVACCLAAASCCLHKELVLATTVMGTLLDVLFPLHDLAPSNASWPDHGLCRKCRCLCKAWWSGTPVRQSLKRWVACVLSQVERCICYEETHVHTETLGR